MSLLHTVPFLLTVLIGLLLGLVTWGFLRVRRHATEDDSVEMRDDVLLALLVLAVFSLGVFVTYILLFSHSM
jgi:hypothetical protein